MKLPKVFNWICVLLMVASCSVIYFSSERQLFEDNDINGKIASFVFVFSLLGFLGNLGVFDSSD